jgi:C-terminal processing protease CtpA/Prc
MSDNVSGLIKHIAAAALQGASKKEIAEKYNIKYNTVLKITSRQDYRDHLMKVSNESLNISKASFKAQITTLQEKAFKVLHELLDSDDLKAKVEGLKLFYRGIGMDTEQQQQSDTNIIVNLPGQPTGRVVEAEVSHGDTVEDGQDQEGISGIDFKEFEVEGDTGER